MGCNREKKFAGTYPIERRNPDMLHWALTFLVVGLIAAVLGFSGVAGAATQIAWILFVVFVILALVAMVMGRRV
jgi:uncharacterized membrane protein YtjA (UPF0391 family)